METSRALALTGAVLLAVVAGTCSGGASRPTADGAARADAEADTNADTIGAGERSDSDNSCQQIRLCVWYCSSETAQPCVQDCIARGSAAARAAFETLVACTAPHCPTGDGYCGCEQRCFVDGSCLTETEACVAGSADLVCDELCH